MEEPLQRQSKALMNLIKRRTLYGGDLTIALQEITETASYILNIERVSVWLYSETRLSLICSDLYELSKNYHSQGLEFTAADYPAYFKGLENDRVIVAHDVWVDPRMQDCLATYLTPLDIRSVLDAPIHMEGRMVGVICHEHKKTFRKWRVDEISMAGSLADLVSLAMESCERNRVEEELKRHKSHLEQQVAKRTAELTYQAIHDPLTGLVNRQEFERRLERVLTTGEDNDPHCVMYLDLDQFKIVNDTSGHVAGDELLKQLAVVLKTQVRKRDTLARLGGDEFGVLLEHCDLDQGLSIAKALIQAVQDFQFGWEHKIFHLGVSIGLVPIPEGGDTLSTIMSAADRACYAAKDKGRNRTHVYQANDLELIKRKGQMNWIAQIHQALQDNRFCLYSQMMLPIQNAGTQPEHHEILLRLVDESGQHMLPGAFIPAAERYGEMSAIDRWVVQNTFSYLIKHPGTNPLPIIYTINLSGQSLGDKQFLDFVIEQIDQTGISPENIGFEVTETAALSDLAAAKRFISTLKNRGCCFALDDFGSGLSSFGYLKELPVDYLKIDGNFVKDMAHDPIDAAIVEAINKIGHTAGLQTIAECVETKAVLKKLTTIGVDYAQGYYIGKPQPIEVI